MVKCVRCLRDEHDGLTYTTPGCLHTICFSCWQAFIVELSELTNLISCAQQPWCHETLDIVPLLMAMGEEVPPEFGGVPQPSLQGRAVFDEVVPPPSRSATPAMFASPSSSYSSVLPPGGSSPSSSAQQTTLTAEQLAAAVQNKPRWPGVCDAQRQRWASVEAKQRLLLASVRGRCRPESAVRTVAQVDYADDEDDGQTVLMWAACYSPAALAYLLGLDDCSPSTINDSRDRRGRTALICAVRGGLLRCVELLLHAGADVCAAPDHDGAGPLDYAASLPASFVPVFRALLRACKQAGGAPSLAVVNELARRNYADHLKLIVADYPDYDFNATDQRGRSPLHHAAAASAAEAARVLLAVAGLALDAPDGDGNTPLILAAKDGNAAIALTLLHAGARLSYVDAVGYTPLMWASERRHSGLVASILNLAEQKFDAAELLSCLVKARAQASVPTADLFARLLNTWPPEQLRAIVIDEASPAGPSHSSFFMQS